MRSLIYSEISLQRFVQSRSRGKYSFGQTSEESFKLITRDGPGAVLLKLAVHNMQVSTMRQNLTVYFL